jgi:hypothetical protein
MAVETLSQRALGRATLARQMLLGRAPLATGEAIEAICGMQAQEPRPPFVGLWSRVEGFAREDLHSALLAGDVVRATLMRATLHLMTARDYAALRPPLQPGIGSALRGIGDRAAGLSLDEVLPAARALFEERPRDFNEVRAELASRFPDVNERALGYAVRLHLPLTMVPTDDRWGFPRSSLFALADGVEVLGDGDGDGGPPLDLLIERYLHAFGPATAADFQTWSGLKGARGAFAGMRDRLAVVTGPDGRDLFDLPDAPRPGEDAAAPPRFLPEFDNLLLAWADRGRVIDDEHRAAVVTKNLRVRATFLWDGRVCGTWSVERKRAAATLTAAPFAALPRKAVRALTDEAERLLRFVEEDAEAFEVCWGEL